MRVLAILVALGACAERIGPAPSDDAQVFGKVRTGENPDGTGTALVDSTSEIEWTHVDIDAFTETDAEGPWDLRFQRFKISVHGDAGAQVARLEQAFAAVTIAPDAGWLVDTDEDGDGTPEPAFELGDGWYDYDPETHVLTPKALTWVVRSSNATIKLRIDTYYDTAGTAGWFTVTWRYL